MSDETEDAQLFLAGFGLTQKPLSQKFQVM